MGSKLCQDFLRDPWNSWRCQNFEQQCVNYFLWCQLSFLVELNILPELRLKDAVDKIENISKYLASLKMIGLYGILLWQLHLCWNGGIVTGLSASEEIEKYIFEKYKNTFLRNTKLNFWEIQNYIFQKCKTTVFEKYKSQLKWGNCDRSIRFQGNCEILTNPELWSIIVQRYKEIHTKLVFFFFWNHEMV